MNSYRISRSRYQLLTAATAVAVAAGILAAPAAANAASPDIVRIDPASRFQTVEGWGTSLAWWANIIGGWTPAQRSAVDQLLFDPTSGLGLNIARYNLGAGVNPDPNKNMRVGAQVPTFEPSNGVWDWTADANQRAVLTEARALGVNVVEGFVNAPPAWMSTYPCTAGAVSGGANLSPSNYSMFADYIAQITQHFKDSWGTTFRTISPYNEPSAGWWKCSNNQEGNHVDVAEQPKVVAAVAAALSARGLNTGVIAGENYSIGDSLASWNAFPTATKALVAQINTHTYAGADSDSTMRVAARTAGTRIWDSEIGVGSSPANPQDITSALTLARSITTDLTQLQADAFVYWQAVEDMAGDNTYGLLKANFTGAQNYVVTKQYYAMANYSRYIKPGSIVLQSNDGATLATWNPASNSLTLVVHNDSSTTRSLSYDLSGFGAVGSQATRIETSAANNAATLSPVPVVGSSVTATLPAQSVTTFVLSGVAVASSGVNLLSNNGFESGSLGPWTASNPALAGVESNFPQSGTRDAYLHPTAAADVNLSQTFTAATAGHVSASTFAATSLPNGVLVGLEVDGQRVDSRPVAVGVGYRRYELGADVQAGQTVKVWFSAPKSAGWATIDSTSATLAPNLLVNGGFESGTTGWTKDWHPAEVTAENNFPFSGTFDGALNTTTGQDAGLSQTITAPRTGTYTVTAAIASNQSAAQLGVDVAGTQVASVNTLANDGYQTRTLTFTATAGQSVKVWFYLPGVVGWATIDSAQLN